MDGVSRIEKINLLNRGMDCGATLWIKIQALSLYRVTSGWSENVDIPIKDGSLMNKIDWHMLFKITFNIGHAEEN